MYFREKKGEKLPIIGRSRKKEIAKENWGEKRGIRIIKKKNGAKPCEGPDRRRRRTVFLTKGIRYRPTRKG